MQIVRHRVVRHALHKAWPTLHPTYFAWMMLFIFSKAPPPQQGMLMRAKGGTGLYLMSDYNVQLNNIISLFRY